MKELIKCNLCPLRCVLREMEYGRCRVRRRFDNVLYTYLINPLTSVEISRIEKIPLYHFYPDKKCLIINLKTPSYPFENNPEGEKKEIFFNQRILYSLLNRKNVESLFFKSDGETFFAFEFLYSFLKKIDFPVLKGIETTGFIMKNPFEEIIKFVDFFTIKIYPPRGIENIDCFSDVISVMREHEKWFEFLIFLNEDYSKYLGFFIEFLRGKSLFDVPLHIFGDIKNISGYFNEIPFKYFHKISFNDEINQIFCPLCGMELSIIAMKERVSLWINNSKCIYCGEKINGRF